MTEGNVPHLENPQTIIRRVFRVIVGGQEINPDPNNPTQQREAKELFLKEIDRLRRGQEIPFDQIEEEQLINGVNREEILAALENTKTPRSGYNESLERLKQTERELRRLEKDHPSLWLREKRFLRHDIKRAEFYHRLTARLKGHPEKLRVLKALLILRDDYREKVERNRVNLRLPVMYQFAREIILQPA